MLFNTVHYFFFLLIVIPVYYLVPAPKRYIWLLMASYYFYMQWNAAYALLLLLCTIVTYTGGYFIEVLKRSNNERTNFRLLNSRRLQKFCLCFCIGINIGILVYYKYFGFGIRMINQILRYIHIHPLAFENNILLPVGISFYTLQSLGYLIDVYRDDIYAEKNFLYYALFVSFFPQLVAGPIERAKSLLTELHEPRTLSFYNMKKGILLVLYGLFVKMVIADRTAIIVDTVFDNVQEYSGFYIVVAAIFFSIQIYCDFYGYSTIARGTALLLGIHLMDNFCAPYFSRSIKEFWRRWHISLSSWFRDYLYIPLGGNRKGYLSKEINMLGVFAISGLWHGASFGFVFWGILNAMYQVVSDFVKMLKKEILIRWKILCIKEKNSCLSVQIFKTIITFLLITFAWIFFRAGGIATAYRIILQMVSENNWIILFDGSIYNLGVEKNHMRVLLWAIVILFVVDYFKYHGKDFAEIIQNLDWVIQLGVMLGMVTFILLYGCYGELYNIQQFIYFQF